MTAPARPLVLSALALLLAAPAGAEAQLVVDTRAGNPLPNAYAPVPGNVTLSPDRFVAQSITRPAGATALSSLTLFFYNTVSEARRAAVYVTGFDGASLVGGLFGPFTVDLDPDAFPFTVQTRVVTPRGVPDLGSQLLVWFGDADAVPGRSISQFGPAVYDHDVYAGGSMFGIFRDAPRARPSPDLDIAVIASFAGRVAPAPEVVPEPATLALLGPAAAAVAVVARRRRVER